MIEATPMNATVLRSVFKAARDCWLGTIFFFFYPQNSEQIFLGADEFVLTLIYTAILRTSPFGAHLAHFIQACLASSRVQLNFAVLELSVRVNIGQLAAGIITVGIITVDEVLKAAALRLLPLALLGVAAAKERKQPPG